MKLDNLMKAAVPLRMLGIVVTQNGKEIGRELTEGACRRNIYSASKSFTSAAVGIAIKEGLLDLNEKITDAFADDLPQTVSDNLKKATVRDLLTMCLGQGKGFLMGEYRPYYTDENWVRLALEQPFIYEPGTKFVYNNVGPYLAGILVQRRSGTDLVHYLYPRMFKPLGIQLPTWETDPYGNTFGAGGLFLTLDELHKFGKLYLDMGRAAGRQIIPEGWVMESTSKQVENDRDGFGYGYLFWGGDKGTFRADGKYGQFSIIFRDKDAVVTLVSESRNADLLLKTVIDEIYPQL